MTYPVDALKNLLVSAIGALPDEIPVWAKGSKDSLDRISVRHMKQVGLQRIGEAARLWALFSGRKVIALVGNVNAGKSSLGNFLLGKQLSEIFAEDDIRATAEATIADFGGHTLIDLPGLGSVLSENDDKIVAEYVYRSDLLVIVHHVGSDMDPVLYSFLQDVAEAPQRYGQRIVFVFNKTDTLAPASLEKTLERYKNVLLDGIQGFAGIRRLFTYEIPMIPFSVFDARSGQLPDRPLRDAIGSAIAASGGDSNQKHWGELKAIREEWSPVQVMAAELKAAGEQCLLNKQGHRDELLQALAKENILQTQMNLVSKKLGTMTTAAITSMGQLPVPTYIEKSRKTVFGAGPKYTEKRDAFCDLCTETLESLNATYSESLSGYFYGTADVINAYYPEAGVPDLSSMDHSLLTGFQTLICTIRDQYLDRLFDGQRTAEAIYQHRVKQQTAKIRADHPKTVKSYQQLILGHIQWAYEGSLEDCKQWDTAVAPFAPFSNYYQQTTNLIRQTEAAAKPVVGNAASSAKANATATAKFTATAGVGASSSASKAMIWIVVVVLIVIILFALLK